MPFLSSSVFQFLPFGLSLLTFAFATAIIGTATHTLVIYDHQRGINPWWIPLWTEHFNIAGTRSLIGGAATILVLNLFFCIASLVPRFQLASRPHFRAAMAVGAALPSALLALSTTVYAHILNANSPQQDTIQTWTCRYRVGGGAMPEGLIDGLPFPAEEGNAMFGQLCTESKFALYGTLTVFFVQILLMGAAVVGWAADMWARRKGGNGGGSSGKAESGEWQDASSLEMKGSR